MAGEHLSRPGEVRLEAIGPEVVVLTLLGEHDMTTLAKLEDAFAGLNREHVLVDLSKVDFVDSTTLHALVNASQSLERSQRRFVVQVGEQGIARRSLEITRLLEVWASASSREEALALIERGV